MLSGTVLDRNSESRAEIAVGTLDAEGDIVELQVQRSARPDIHQKNWVPLVRGDAVFFVYKTDPTVILRLDPASGQARVVETGRPTLRLDHLRGGSQAIAVPGGWLYATHEVVPLEGSRRRYLHRFVLLGEDFKVLAVTDPFSFLGRNVELCAGLVREPMTGKLIASFGADDASAQLAFLDEHAVLAALRSA